MGTVFNACDYSNSVKIQLLCFRATNAVSSISDYLIEEEENVRKRWNKPWEIITQCCLGLKKWRVWAFYEHQPLNIPSEAWLEALFGFTVAPLPNSSLRRGSVAV